MDNVFLTICKTMKATKHKICKTLDSEKQPSVCIKYYRNNKTSESNMMNQLMEDAWCTIQMNKMRAKV